MISISSLGVFFEDSEDTLICGDASITFPEALFPVPSAVTYAARSKLTCNMPGVAKWNGYYAPYGERKTTVNLVAPRRYFAEEIYDSSTEMYNFGFRHYNQSFGGFMSENPLGSSSNQYTYCDHDPMNYLDPDGLIVETLFDIGAPVEHTEDFCDASLVGKGNLKGFWCALSRNL